MKPRTLGALLRVACVLAGLMGAVVLCFLFKDAGGGREVYYVGRALPWLSIPCWAALILFWRVAGNIGRDRSFCGENVRLMRAIAILAFLTSAAMGVVGVVFLAAQLVGLRIFCYLVCIVVLGICLGAASLALSVLVDRARAIQEENDFTV